MWFITLERLLAVLLCWQTTVFAMPGGLLVASAGAIGVFVVGVMGVVGAASAIGYLAQAGASVGCQNNKLLF